MKSIFSENGSGELIEMKLAAPKEERILQDLIERHPILISLADEKLMLVQREAGASGTEAHGERWSLDHLFVTPDAIPVLIEVKRAADTRIRREVIGQMLDYAANGSIYWTADTMDTAFRGTCERMLLDPDEALAEFIAEGLSTEDFWPQVQANLRAGRIKLRFIADRIPEELGRVVGFLNAHTDMEVLAVELGYYRSDSGNATIVPSLIGQSEKVVQQSRVQKEPNPLLQEIIGEFSQLDCPLSTRSEGRGTFVQLQYGADRRHYEWLIKKSLNELHVAVHFEGKDAGENLRAAEAIRAPVESLARELGVQAQVGQWGRKWASSGIILNLSQAEQPAGPRKAAEAMVLLIEKTLPMLTAREDG